MPIADWLSMIAFHMVVWGWNVMVLNLTFEAVMWWERRNGRA